MAGRTIMNHPEHKSQTNDSHLGVSPLVERTLSVLFSLTEKSTIASPLDQPAMALNSAALLSFDCSAASLRAFARAGFRHIRPFVALPSLTEPRWLVPGDNSRQAIRGLRMYAPFSTRTRVLKAVGTAAAAAGFPGIRNSRVFVASREALPIENLVRALSEETRPGFAISIGFPGTCQKMTVQVMSPAGDVLAYIKLPLGPQAPSRIRAEAATLEKLREFPKMRSRMPRLLSFSEWGAGRILVQTRLPGAPGPSELTRHHEEFLRDLHSCGRVERAGGEVLEETADAWKRLATRLGSTWRDLAREAFRLAARELTGARLLCAPMHGDFAPWNSRAHSGQISYFDWESAHWQAPIHWDRFHFLAQAESLINKGAGPESLPETRNGARGSFILYLLYSVAQLAAENSTPAALAYREQLLRRQLSGEMAGAPSGISGTRVNAAQDPTFDQEGTLGD